MFKKLVDERLALSEKLALRNAEEGFTLVELIIAMAIIVTLVVSGWGVYSKMRRKQEVTSTLDFLHALETAVENFRNDTGYVPRNLRVLWNRSDFTTTNYPGCNPQFWNGPYMKPPQENYNANYLYTPTGKTVVWTTGTATVNGQTINYYGVTIQGLTREVCEDIDRRYDNNVSPTSGRVRYSASSGGYYNLTVFLGEL